MGLMPIDEDLIGKDSGEEVMGRIDWIGAGVGLDWPFPLVPFLLGWASHIISIIPNL